MSFFGFGGGKSGSSPNVNSPSSGDSQQLSSPSYDTGRNIDDIVKGLLIALDDADIKVHKTIHQSLISIGDQCELLLLSKSLHFLNNICSKSNKKHRVLVMNILTELLNMKPSSNDFAIVRASNVKAADKPLKVPDDLSRALVLMAINEMVQDKSINSDWQASACNLLIALSRYVPDLVTGQLLERFPISSTNPPHYFVIKALSDIAFYYPLLFIGNLKEVLSRTLPLLALIKHDNLRWVFCAALGRWSEAAIYCLELSEKPSQNNAMLNPIDKSTISQYHSSILTAMKHILLEWLNVRETKIRLAAAQSIGYMCHIIETDQLNQLLPKLIPNYVNSLKKEVKEDPLPVTIGLQHIVKVVVRDCATSLNDQLQPILGTLFSVLITTMTRRQSYKNANRNITEVLRTFHFIAKAYTDQVVSFVQAQLEQPNGSAIVHVSALKTLRYLVLNNDDDLVSYRDVIVSGLMKILKDPSNQMMIIAENVEVHNEFSVLIHTLAQHDGYMNSQGGTDLVHVILRGCAISEKRISDDLKTKIPASLVSTVGSEEKAAQAIMTRNEKEDAIIFDEKSTTLSNSQANTEDEENNSEQSDENRESSNSTPSSPQVGSSTNSKEGLDPQTLPQVYTWYQVRETCDRILLSFTTKLGEEMDKVLWPFLLESFVMPLYDTAFPVLCRAIADISKRKKNDDDFIIDFDAQVNIPKPNFIFARLLLKLTVPFGRNQPAVNILRALYCLSPNIHPDVVQLWGKKLPTLKKYIDTCESNASFVQDEWDNHLLNLVRDSIDSVQDDKWAVALGEALLEHSEIFYKNNRLLKKSLLSTVGLIIQKSQLKQFIHSAVERCFKITDHTNDEERLGCARGLGQAAVNHCDTVLAQLQNVMKAPEKKTGFFARNTGNEVTHFERATAMLSYGYVSMLTPLSLITSRVEVHIIKNMIPILKPQPPQPIPYELKENGLKAIDLIGKSVHPSRLQDFILKSRDELIKLVIQIMTPSPQLLQQATTVQQLLSINKLRILGLDALSTLVKLPPKVEVEIQNEIFNSILPLLKIKTTVKTDPKQPPVTGLDDLVSTDDSIIESHNNVLFAILHTDNSQGSLDDILRALETDHMNSTNALERERACSIYVSLLKDFAKLISQYDQSATNNVFGNSMTSLGRIIGQLIPRITESVTGTRKYGLDGIYLVLRIQHLLEHIKSQNDELPEYIENIVPLRNQLFEASNVKELFEVTKELSQILCEAIKDKNHLMNLIDTLIDTLNDPEVDGANSSCIVLNGLIRSRGKELEHEAVNYVKKMIKLIPQFISGQREQIVSGLLHGVRGFTRHFPLLVMNTLIAYPVPHTIEVTKCFQIISTDPMLNQQLLDHLLDIINNAQLYEEKRASDSVDLFPTHTTVSATQSLYEILSVEDFSSVAMKNYSQIIVTALIRVGSANEMTVNPPTKFAQQCIVNFYKLTQEVRRNAKLEALEELEQNGHHGSEENEDHKTTIQERRELIIQQTPTEIEAPTLEMLLQKTQYGDAVQSILERICKSGTEYVRPMFEYVKPFISRTFIGQRVIATCIVSVLLNHIQNDRELVHNCINALLGRSGTDEQIVVKLYALRGLSNLSIHPKDILHQYVTPVIGALLSNLEDLNQAVVLEAMTSVKKIFKIAEDQYISPLLMNLCVRLKPSFEKKDPQIREASIKLFGALYRFCDGVMRETLVATIFNNLPILLCHVHDPEDRVSYACRLALSQLVPTLKSEAFTKIFEENESFKVVDQDDPNAPLPSMTPLNFDEFAEIFAKTWIREFPERVSDLVMNLVVFYKSEWHTVCACAVLIIGHLLANLSQDQRSRVNLRHTTQGLTELLKSPSSLIREKASKMLGLLYEA
nr:unnamed protein product [Naegleria fowleri]